MIATIFLDWAPRDWSAAGQVLLGLGAVIGGVWGVYVYARARRDEAARWLHSFFLTFYTDRDMIAARNALTYSYAETAPILELRVTDRDVVLTSKEQEQLRLADLLLNYFEEIIFLQEGHHLTKKDRDLFFEYWLGLLRKPDYAALRRYAAKCGYEHVASWSGAGEDEYIAMSTGIDPSRIVSEQEDVEYVGSCAVHAAPIGDLGAFGEGSAPVTEAHLFRLRGGATFRGLDKKMGYAAAGRSVNLARRRCVHLAKPALDAWIYLECE